MMSKASVKVKMPRITVRVSRLSGSGAGASLTSGGGSRRIFDTRTPPDARLTVCFSDASGLAMAWVTSTKRLPWGESRKQEPFFRYHVACGGVFPGPNKVELAGHVA